MTVSPIWLQAAILTLIFGFAVLGYAAVRVYRDAAPVPERVVDEAGKTLFDRRDILEGQEHFLTYGLMEYGTVYGHGAYLGPDFTADYLHREALGMKARYGGDDAAERRMRRELQANGYDPGTGTLAWSEGQVAAFEANREHLDESFLDRSVSGAGLKPHLIADPEQRRQVAAFIAWTAWTSTARRPGKAYSYTNNWPPEELAGNSVTGEAIVWSALSLVALLGASGSCWASTAATAAPSAGTRPRSVASGSCRRRPWP
jgi:nitric oxide reductase subunit B